MRQRKFRIGQIVADDVAPGDILIDVPYDQGGIRLDRARTIGTVLTVRGERQGLGETRSWLVRTGAGVVKDWPEEPVNRSVNTYVHVPWGQL